MVETRGCERKDKKVKDKEFVRLLERDFKEVRFVWDSPRFSYRLKKGTPTIFLGGPQPNFGLLALHELGHALSGHKDYTVDVERIRIESEAWEKAKTVYQNYKKQAKKDLELAEILPEWDEDFVQDKLDTYRDWLHKKSRCPECGLTRFQDSDGYHCPRCENLV